MVGIYGGASTDASYFITVKIDNVEVDTIEISVLKSDTDVPKYINPQVSGFLQSQSTNTLHLLVQGNFNCAANIANIVVTPSGANASYIAVAAETPQTGDTVAKFDISLNNQTNNSEGNFTITVTDPTDGVQP
ncbi:hypothetical protein FACS1894166_09690 [Bacilli bacterium]|nr:hypothetical protein FACS1894166_09690 [Bacilli bacterium]